MSIPKREYAYDYHSAYERYESPDHKKGLAWTAGLLIVFVVAAVIVAENNSKISFDEYQRLSNGMTYQQVVSVIGGPPNSSISIDSDLFDGTAYIWAGNRSESAATLEFSRSGHLISKAEMGLSMGGPAPRDPYSNAEIQLETRPVTYKRSYRPTAVEAPLPPDIPFPSNGAIQRSLPLSGNIARLQFQNRSDQNVVAIWYYNLGHGDQEAARLYVAAWQSAMIDLPTYDYRLGVISAPKHHGLNRGFGQNAQIIDQGFVDLKTPASRLSRLPSVTFYQR